MFASRFRTLTVLGCLAHLVGLGTAGLAIGSDVSASNATADGFGADRPGRAAMVQQIDALLEEQWRKKGFEPAPLASDSEFLRRASLDLTGVVPRVSEVREFLADSSSDKRERLIDELLASPRYATHMATTWRKRMLPQEAEAGSRAETLGVQNWLHRHFAKNTRFDNVVADLLVATDGNELGPALFYQAQGLAPEKLAASTAELFLGMRLHCAQCHDHPYGDWSQEDFWGLAAFFARVRGPDGMMQRDSFRLTDAPTGEVTIPGTDRVVPPKYLAGRYADEAEGGTRRLQLAIWIASRENPYLARATANWAWAHLFGRGLVHPVGDAGTHNPPIHPELLDELSEYLVQIEFDLKELWRTLARTRAYQLTSQPADPDKSPAVYFASMNVKPLTPEQLYDSLTQAAPINRDALSANARPQVATMSMVLDPRRAEFIRLMRSPSDGSGEFSSGILQTLMLINGQMTADLASPETSRLLGAIDAPFLTDEQKIDALFLATVSRFPRVEEYRTCLEYLTSENPDVDRQEALSDILWSVLNTTEFAFNH